MTGVGRKMLTPTVAQVPGKQEKGKTVWILATKSYEGAERVLLLILRKPQRKAPKTGRAAQGTMQGPSSAGCSVFSSLRRGDVERVWKVNEGRKGQK